MIYLQKRKKKDRKYTPFIRFTFKERNTPFLHVAFWLFFWCNLLRVNLCLVWWEGRFLKLHRHCIRGFVIVYRLVHILTCDHDKIHGIAAVENDKFEWLVTSILRCSILSCVCCCFPFLKIWNITKAYSWSCHFILEQ